MSGKEINGTNQLFLPETQVSSLPGATDFFSLHLLHHVDFIFGFSNPFLV